MKLQVSGDTKSLKDTLWRVANLAWLAKYNEPLSSNWDPVGLLLEDGEMEIEFSWKDRKNVGNSP